MLPSLFFFIGFVVIPMITCIFLSLTDANMHSAGNFIGLGNFIRLWGDQTFLDALKNTFVIVIVRPLSHPFAGEGRRTLFSLLGTCIHNLRRPSEQAVAALRGAKAPQ